MAKRSYQQYCPLAHALDLVGERWTLLVVRELQLGPRRFSDLARGLPGLSPNLLSERLRALESWGLISTEPLPPPAKLEAYVLTPAGQALNAALFPLAQWGVQFLQMPIPDDEFLGAIPAMASLRLLFQPTMAETERLSAELHLEPDCFRLLLTAAELHLEQGFSPEAALVLYTDPKPLLGLATGMLAVRDALDGGLLQIRRGTPDAVKMLFAQFSLPTGRS